VARVVTRYVDFDTITRGRTIDPTNVDFEIYRVVLARAFGVGYGASFHIALTGSARGRTSRGRCGAEGLRRPAVESRRSVDHVRLTSMTAKTDHTLDVRAVPHGLNIQTK
jgi:hypothetical protein